MTYFVKILISSLIITFSTEVAKRNPSFGGLILSLPLTSLIAYLIMGFEKASPQLLNDYAKSTLIFVPASLIFFVPFVLPQIGDWSFISKFSIGLVSLILINIFLSKFISL